MHIIVETKKFKGLLEFTLMWVVLDCTIKLKL